MKSHVILHKFSLFFLSILVVLYGTKKIPRRGRGTGRRIQTYIASCHRKYSSSICRG